MKIKPLLLDESVSDIHIVQTGDILYRKGGKSALQKFEEEKLNRQEIDAIVKDIVKRPVDSLYIEREEIDCPFKYAGTRWRVNVALSDGIPFVTLRRIAKTMKTPEVLGIPDEIVEAVLKFKDGLVIFAGATGSGKSTSMASLLEKRMKERNYTERIITIEDPIEYYFDHPVVSQREVGKDTQSFYRGLRAAMREDPNIILLGEVRDFQTAEACLQAAETGHLVLTTLHATSVDLIPQRFLGLFPKEEERGADLKFKSVLRLAVVQRIVDKKLQAEWKVF